MSVRNIQITIGSSPVGKAVTWAYPDGSAKELYEIPTYSVKVSGIDNNRVKKSRVFEALRFGVQKKGKIGPRVVGLANRQTHKVKKWIGSYRVHSAQSPENGAWQIYGNFLIHDGPDNPHDTSQPYASIGCVEICNARRSFVAFNDFILALAGATASSRNGRLQQIGKSGKLVVTYEKTRWPKLKKWAGP